MPTPAQYSLRAATPSDRELIRRFLHSPTYTHRHLDWRDALDWLGSAPFWILEKNGVLEAVLACIVEPVDVAWVRLFSAGSNASPSWAWNILFERVYSWLAEQPSRPVIAALGLQEWFGDMLANNGFQHYQDIIVFSYEDAAPPPPSPDPALVLRPMTSTDLPAVTRVDNVAFEPVPVGQPPVGAWAASARVSVGGPATLECPGWVVVMIPPSATGRPVRRVTHS